MRPGCLLSPASLPLVSPFWGGKGRAVACPGLADQRSYLESVFPFQVVLSSFRFALFSQVLLSLLLFLHR